MAGFWAMGLVVLLEVSAKWAMGSVVCVGWGPGRLCCLFVENWAMGVMVGFRVGRVLDKKISRGGSGKNKAVGSLRRPWLCDWF